MKSTGLMAVARIIGVALSVSGTESHAANGLSLAEGTTIELANSAGKFDFLRVDSLRQRLLAAHEVDETADIFDLRAGRLVKRLTLGGVVDTAIDAESKHYFFSVQTAHAVTVVDAETLQTVRTIKTPGPTDAIVYLPKTRRVYVTFDGGDAVWVIDPAEGKVVSTIKVAGVPEFMVYDDVSDRIYLNLKSKNAVAVIDPGENVVVSQWSTTPATSPHGLAIDGPKHRAYAAGTNGKLVAIDTATGSVVGSADIVAKVDQIALDAVGSWIYCAGGERISVVHVVSDKLDTRGDIPAAPTAKNVAVDPLTRQVWTTYTDGKSSFARSWLPPSL